MYYSFNFNFSAVLIIPFPQIFFRLDWLKQFSRNTFSDEVINITSPRIVVAVSEFF